jgi:hypothetical protein
MRTIELDQAATVGDTVYLDGRGWTVSDSVYFDGWNDCGRLEPVEPELLDSLAPYSFRLRSNIRGSATAYVRGVVYSGAARLETTGRAIVKRNGAHWLRCRVELWNMETVETLRGLVRLD